VKINNLDTYCEQVVEGRTAKRDSTLTQHHIIINRPRQVSAYSKPLSGLVFSRSLSEVFDCNKAVLEKIRPDDGLE
jgi:hypothetical protein